MAKRKAISYPIRSAAFAGEYFRVGEDRVEEIRRGPGLWENYESVLVKLSPCETNPDCPTERRFQVGLLSAVFELDEGEEIEVEVPDERPSLLTPDAPTLVLPR